MRRLKVWYSCNKINVDIPGSLSIIKVPCRCLRVRHAGAHHTRVCCGFYFIFYLFIYLFFFGGGANLTFLNIVKVIFVLYSVPSPFPVLDPPLASSFLGGGANLTFLNIVKVIFVLYSVPSPCSRSSSGTAEKPKGMIKGPRGRCLMVMHTYNLAVMPKVDQVRLCHGSDESNSL